MAKPNNYQLLYFLSFRILLTSLRRSEIVFSGRFVLLQYCRVKQRAHYRTGNRSHYVYRSVFTSSLSTIYFVTAHLQITAFLPNQLNKNSSNLVVAPLILKSFIKCPSKPLICCLLGGSVFHFHFILIGSFDT